MNLRSLPDRSRAFARHARVIGPTCRMRRHIARRSMARVFASVAKPRLFSVRSLNFNGRFVSEVGMLRKALLCAALVALLPAAASAQKPLVGGIGPHVGFGVDPDQLLL